MCPHQLHSIFASGNISLSLFVFDFFSLEKFDCSSILLLLLLESYHISIYDKTFRRSVFAGIAVAFRLPKNELMFFFLFFVFQILNLLG